MIFDKKRKQGNREYMRESSWRDSFFDAGDPQCHFFECVYQISGAYFFHLLREWDTYTGRYKRKYKIFYQHLHYRDLKIWAFRIVFSKTYISPGMTTIFQPLEKRKKKNTQNKPACKMHDAFHQKCTFLFNIYIPIKDFTVNNVISIYFLQLWF